MKANTMITEVFQQLIGELTRDPDQSQMVLCPFHPDGTPSMKLDLDKNVAFCYSCRQAWTPEQFERSVRGDSEDGSLKKDSTLEMVEVFERQILNKIRTAGRKPAEFKKVFVALDLARAQESVSYSDLQRINSAVDHLLG